MNPALVIILKCRKELKCLTMKYDGVSKNRYSRYFLMIMEMSL